MHHSSLLTSSNRLLSHLLFLCLFLAALTGCAIPKNDVIYNEAPYIHVDRIQERPCSPQWSPAKGLIVIDAGHGGKDLGTNSTSPQYEEKFLTLSTARILKGYLEQLGYATLLTRSDDRFIALNKRAEFANNSGPDAFVSIHFNSAPNKEAHGIEIFYYRSEENKQRSSDSKALAKKVLDHMLEETGAKSRGVKHGDLAVIRETAMPAILVEGGFLSNDQEAKSLKNGIYLKKLAWGIAQGIDAYLK